MKITEMSHNACYAKKVKWNYIIEWWQKSDADQGRIHRLIDSFLDYTATGALAQFEQMHYINAVVIAVYPHSPYTPAEVE